MSSRSPASSVARGVDPGDELLGCFLIDLTNALPCEAHALTDLGERLAQRERLDDLTLSPVEQAEIPTDRLGYLTAVAGLDELFNGVVPRVGTGDVFDRSVSDLAAPPVCVPGTSCGDDAELGADRLCVGCQHAAFHRLDERLLDDVLHVLGVDDLGEAAKFLLRGCIDILGVGAVEPFPNVGVAPGDTGEELFVFFGHPSPLCRGWPSCPLSNGAAASKGVSSKPGCIS